jgi:hypothetical protein
VNLRVAYPDRVSLSSHSAVTDVDVVIARGQVNARARTQCDVAVAGGIA